MDRIVFRMPRGLTLWRDKTHPPIQSPLRRKGKRVWSIRSEFCLQAASGGAAKTILPAHLAPPPGSAILRDSSGRSAAWLAHQTGGLGVAGSNPVAPTERVAAIGDPFSFLLAFLYTITTPAPVDFM
jgi:hypothetical protein